MELLKQAESIQNDIVRIRREIHKTAELKLETFETAKIITRELIKIGITDIRPMLDGAAVAATIVGAYPGKCLGIRLDCDALPIREETDEPFKSVNGNMHACGHDTHTAIGIGAAKLIYDNRSSLHGSVKMIFQPGEEGSLGAKPMIAEGVLENPTVDAVIGFHSSVLDSRLPEFPAGCIATTSGFSSSACVMAFKVTLHGKGAHGGIQPHLSVDPIVMGSMAIMQLQTIISRERDPLDTAVLSICHVEAGERNNIIPDTFFMEGTIRTLSSDYAHKIFSRVETICRSVAESMGGTSEAKVVFEVPDTKTDAILLKKLRISAEKTVGRDKLYTLLKPYTGGEDLAFFSERVPTVHFIHSQRFSDGREQYAAHSSKFISCEDGYYTASAVLANFALDWQDTL